MEIIKASGEKEIFDKNKFCNSLKNTGAPKDIVKKVCDLIEKEVEPGMTTSHIFRLATRHLMEASLAVASRYNLKRGIAELGPAGFLFEKFLEIVLKELKYETLRNQIMDGKCVDHEIDILAKKGDRHYLIEAKYHNRVGIKTPIDVVMYADARLQDIAFAKENEERGGESHYMWLITNTKFTSKAIKYALCRGIKLTGWNYPSGDGLENIVTKYSLYPVTTLSSVNRYAREQFAKYDMMLVRDLTIYSPKDLISKFGIHENNAKNIVKQTHALMYGEEPLLEKK